MSRKLNSTLFTSDGIVLNLDLFPVIKHDIDTCCWNIKKYYMLISNHKIKYIFYEGSEEYKMIGEYLKNKLK